MKALVLDTSSFIQGFNNNDLSIQLFTTSLARNEIREGMANIRLENMIHTGRLTVSTPDEKHLSETLEASRSIGENKALSDTDHSVIALALQLRKKYQVTVVSDDYSVQNLSNELGLNHRGLATPGIKKRYSWIHYCPGCWKHFDSPQPDNECPICGTEVKRKPMKKKAKRRV